MNFEDILSMDFVFLYAGDLPNNPEYRNVKKAGLSLTQNDDWHIKHDISLPHPIPDATVNTYQSEDVFEHIEFEKIKSIIFDIYRILKNGGLFRLSVPDYRCDVLHNRSLRDNSGNILFDPGGGGEYKKRYFMFGKGKVTNGGHIWFPKYETVKKLLTDVPFSSIDFLHYYDENGNPHVNRIDYKKGFIQRTPDNDKRVASPYRPMSLVVDCIK